ncbi:zinc-dependent peptidase [Adhaeribacter terreus]|uniref:Zinc-dependent peptidase n=1 Tax=Adhaeribacter terreus TaxID=529703 RepID=A0ABW0EIN9_9BACT
MAGKSPSTEFKTHYQNAINSSLKTAGILAVGALGLAGMLVFYGKPVAAVVLGGICFLLIFIFHRHYTRNNYKRLNALKNPLPASWQTFLEENSLFYNNLSDADKSVFNKRVQFFLAEKKIEGVSTEIDDNLKLLVAASAIIPTFAFPLFEYPNLKQVLIYPNSFDRNFQTDEAADRENQIIAGMVGNGFMNGTLLLSKTDLVNGFQGKNPHNVGIHEFVHLLDMADGAIDGLPEIFLNNAYTLPWLKVIQEEVRKIKNRKSDINPYGLTNNAEFLAVVSEYFFDNPEKFQDKHPDLYEYLCVIFQQRPDKPSLRWMGKLKPQAKE